MFGSYSDENTGTIAAGMQGPAIVAGSAFAGAQAVAMGAALPAIGYTIAGGVSAGAAAGAAYGATWFSGKPDDEA